MEFFHNLLLTIARMLAFGTLTRVLSGKMQKVGSEQNRLVAQSDGDATRSGGVIAGASNATLVQTRRRPIIDQCPNENTRGVIVMAGKTSKKSATATRKSSAKRAMSRAAGPRTVAKSSPRRSVKAAAKRPPARRAPSKGANQQKVAPASQLIDTRVRELHDWRGSMLARLRSLIRDVDPEVIEEWKWRGVPVWSHDGIICTGETYKGVVKLTFFRGAQLDDPAKLFNSSLEGNARRAIDFREEDAVDEAAFKALIRVAIELNRSVAASRTRKS